MNAVLVGTEGDSQKAIDTGCSYSNSIDDSVLQQIKSEVEECLAGLAKGPRLTWLNTLHPGTRQRHIEACKTRLQTLQNILAAGLRDGHAVSVEELDKRIADIESSVKANGERQTASEALSQDAQCSIAESDSQSGSFTIDCSLGLDTSPEKPAGRDIMRDLPLLKPTRVLTGVNGAAAVIQPVSLEQMHSYPDDRTKNRLLRLDTHRDTSKLRNLALVDPDAYFVPSKYLYVKDSWNCGIFFAVGFCSWSSLHLSVDQPQICVTPSQTTWPRLCAVVGAVFKARCLYTSTFRNGVAFSTMRRISAASPSPSQLPRQAQPIQGGHIYPQVRAYNDPVEVFDGRHDSFKLCKYRHLPRFHGPVPADAAVVVVYTVSRYENRGRINVEGLEGSVGFNVLDVIVLSNPGECSWDGIGGGDEECLGVLPDCGDESDGTLDDESDDGDII